MKGESMDITGKKVGKLTVIKRNGEKISPCGRVEKRWLCKCDCGNFVTVGQSNLVKEKTKSCGCLRKENSTKGKRKGNRYDLSGDYGIGYAPSGREFYFDLEDYDKVKQYTWCVEKSGYVVSTVYHEDGTKDRISMHRVVMDNPKGKQVDHIHGRFSKNDNRKSNLRIVTNQQNAMNKKREGNYSGVVGVRWNKQSRKWDARITFKGKAIFLGSFKDIDDAEKARKEAEEKYFGEYSYENSQKI